MPSNTDLWQRIQAFDIDNAEADFPFSSRLARENGWKYDEALAAIDEYKKFIYLVCVSPVPLTPSEVVDQVWHLHLVYTRSYWNDFCEGVLGRSIHHDPTTGGQAQAQLFEGQHAQTRSLYEAEFGFEPPLTYWPLQPLATQQGHRWIDRRKYWLIPKRGAIRTGLGIASLALFIVLASSGELWAAEPSGSSLGSVVGGLIGLAVMLSPFWLMAAVGPPPEGDYANHDPNRSTWGFSVDDGGCGGGCGGCGGCGG
jgi:hypothetical protein